MESSKNPEELKKEGNLAYKNKLYQNAIDLYSQAFEASNDFNFKSILCSNMANSYYQLGKYEEGLKSAIEGCKANPSNLKVFYWKAMSLWKIGKLDEGLEIVEGLLKKDINNVDFKELAQNLVREYKETKIRNSIEDIKRAIANNNEIKLRIIIDHNIENIKEILIDSRIIHDLIESLWNSRKIINNPLLAIFVYLINKCTELGLQPIFSSELPMISEILTSSPKYIPDLMQKCLMKTNIPLSQELLEFINTLLIVPQLDNEQFVSICDLLLCKSNEEITFVTAQKVIRSFLEKFAEILTESKDYYELYKQCMERIIAFINVIKEKDRMIEYIKQNVHIAKDELIMKSVVACEIFAFINPKECIDFLSSKDLLV